MAQRHFIIDTDTASDDAVALLMAHHWPDVVVDAITVVSGNVPLAQGSINARYTVEICGKETPVYEGADRPLLRRKSTFRAMDVLPTRLQCLRCFLVRHEPCTDRLTVPYIMDRAN